MSPAALVPAVVLLVSIDGNAACTVPPGPSFATSLATQNADRVDITGGCIAASVVNGQVYYAPAFKGIVSGQFCTWDALHDVGDCINGAIAAARAAGAQEVVIPPGTFGQTVEVAQTSKSGVSIEGAGAPGFYGVCVTTLKWIGSATGKSLHLLGHASNSLFACRSNRFITSGGFGRDTATRPVADTDTNPSLNNYIYQNVESGAVAPLINGSATLTYQTNTGDYYSNAGTSLVQGGMAYKAAGTNNAVFDIDTANSSNFATLGKFGPTLPVYLLYNNPIIGFNQYWGSAAFRYGKGSSGNYAGRLAYSATAGSCTLLGTTATGNADAAVTGDTQLWSVERNGHVRVSANAAPALTSCGTNPAIVGDDRGGEVTMGTGTPTGCVITFATAYAAAPLCTVTWQATPLASQSYAISASAITLAQTATSSNKVNYTCNARSGG